MKGVSLLAGICLLCASAASGRAQDVVVQLVPGQSEYVVNEPVFVHLTVTNQGSVPADLPAELDLDTQNTTYYVVPPGGETSLRIDPGYVKEPVGRRLSLPPGEHFGYAQPIFYDRAAEGPLFREAGNWQLRAVLEGLGRFPDIETPAIQITVKPPEPADAEPATIFATAPVVQLIMNLGDDDGAVASLERIIDEHGDSRFADYAQFYLARRETHGFFERRPNPAAAIARLDALLGAPLHAPQLEAPALELLGRAYEAAGETSPAVESYRQLLRKHPESPGNAAVSERLRVLQQNLELPASASAAPHDRALPSATGLKDAHARRDRTEQTPGAADGGASSPWLYAVVAVAALVVAGIFIRRLKK